MRPFITSILIVTLLISCSKSDLYTTRLVSIKYDILSAPKVYTKKGEITDKTVVANYINAWVGTYFFFNTDTVVHESADTILFKTKDTLIIPFLQGQWGTRVVKPSGGYLFFYLPDTLLGYKRTDNVLYSITDKIGIVKPFRQNGCGWSGGTNGSSCPTEWVYDAYIAHGSTYHLEFPLMTYKITRRQNGISTGIAAQNYNNIFDPMVLNLLQEGDTLAIQTARRIYVRRN